MAALLTDDYAGRGRLRPIVSAQYSCSEELRMDEALQKRSFLAFTVSIAATLEADVWPR
jgi:hypothetical protein